MTIEMAKEEIPNMEVIKRQICNCCKSNDAYCRKECGVLKQAERCGLEKLQRLYAEYDGAEWEIARYLQAQKRERR